MCEQKFDECTECANYCDSSMCDECDSGEMFEPDGGLDFEDAA